MMTKNDYPELIHASFSTKFEVKEGQYFMKANSGQPMVGVNGFDVPVVINLEGATFEKEVTPILCDHSDTLPIGVTTAQQILATNTEVPMGTRILNTVGIYAQWKLTSTSAKAEEIRANIEGGFPYEVSIGARSKDLTYIDEHQTALVNGQEFQGPLIVANTSKIHELSIVVFGACPGTSNVKASRKGQKEVEMENVIENTPAPIVEKQPETNLNDVQIQAKSAPSVVIPAVPTEAEIRAKKEKEAEDTRRLSIDTIAKCANIQAGARVAIDDAEFKTINAAKNYALKNGITADAFQKAVIEASLNRPVGPMVHIAGNGECKRSEVIQAAALMNCGVDGDWLEKGKHYTPAVIEAADRERSNTGLLSLMGEVIQATGGKVDYRNPRRIVEDYKTINASNVSTMEFGDINVMSPILDKQMRYQFERLESIWERLYRKRVVRDFKKVATVDFAVKGTAKTILENEDYPQVLITSDGEQYNTAKQGVTAGISFEQQINDDMGALNAVAGELVNMLHDSHCDSFWGTFWGCVSTNYTTTNKNKTTKKLTVAGLTAAKKLFKGIKNANGRFVNIPPQFLLVPPALEDVAMNLFHWQWAGEDNTKGNIHVGKYQVVCDPYLGADGGFTGATDTGWFMVGDTGRYPLGEYAVLSGYESPAIKESWYDHKDTLNMRALCTIGFHAYTNKLAAVYSDGTVD